VFFFHYQLLESAFHDFKLFQGIKGK
jgi:hypothetical protein